MVFHAITEAAIAEYPLEHRPCALLTTVSRASETQIDEPDPGRLDAGACSMDRGLQALGMTVTTTQHNGEAEAVSWPATPQLSTNNSFAKPTFESCQFQLQAVAPKRLLKHHGLL